MFDNMWWKFFERTGNIDAYLLYKNTGELNKIVDVETEPENKSKVANMD